MEGSEGGWGWLGDVIRSIKIWETFLSLSCHMQLLPNCLETFHGGRSFILTPRSATEAAQAARIDELLL